MLKPAKRFFNTSGPNNPEENYTLMREDLVAKGIDLVDRKRYFTIWAPRQTGKSTYFRLLAERLKTQRYSVTHINVENFLSATEASFLNHLTNEIKITTSISINAKIFSDFYDRIKNTTDKNVLLIIDEIEGLNPEIFGQFLHTIRNLYHSRDTHCLKSVILVGVSNIVGIVQDHASPFNIADNLDVPYFTNEEVYELLNQHEEETGQMFDDKVKEKISYITACQPGLVNGFALQLVERNKDKEVITIDDYLEVEDWYIRKAIDKNVSNIVNKAKKYRNFVEGLLYRETPVEFDIERESIKVLHANGLIREGQDKNVEFWVPLYKKKLYSAFYPYLNGEENRFFANVLVEELFTKDKKGKQQINFNTVIKNYKKYVKERGFSHFREKDEETGQYISIKEAALLYSFEGYISFFLLNIKAKSYLEVPSALGRSDLVINYNNKETVIETKIYRNTWQYNQGKKQLSYYCKSRGLKEGIYLVFVSNIYNRKKLKLNEKMELIQGVKIKIHLIDYDEEKDF